MRIAIVGAGFTGLSAAYKLSTLGEDVTVFEKEDKVGGLGNGFKEDNWSWNIDKYYHHLFTNDKTALELAKEVNQKILILRPKTSTLINNSIYQLDSPLSLLKFPLLSFFERLKMGVSLAFLRYNPFYFMFKKYKAESFLPKIMGKKGFELIWHPLFKSKFGDFSKEVSLDWFWARVKKRTSSLAYPEGGFTSFANKIEEACKKKKCVFNLNSEVLEIGENLLKVKKNNKVKTEKFDKIIATTPTPIFLKQAKLLSREYSEKLRNIKSLATTNLLIRLKKPFLTDGTYWLNVCDPNSKLMAVVEHTNFINRKFYNDEFLVYVGHYLPSSHAYINMSKQELLDELNQDLKKINPNYKKHIIGIEKSQDFFAQPIFTVGYGKRIPSHYTSIKNVYLANLDQVYPWDRGVNYAIELGEKVANVCRE